MVPPPGTPLGGPQWWRGARGHLVLSRDKRRLPRRGGGGAGRVPPYGSGKAPPPPCRAHLRSRAAPLTSAPLAATATMQETNNFLLSALQPEAGVCSLALPSDRQLDGRGREAAEAQRLRSARVQEQVRIRMLLRGQAAAAHPEAAVLDQVDGRGGRPPGGFLLLLLLFFWRGVGGSPFPMPTPAPHPGAKRVKPGLVSPRASVSPHPEGSGVPLPALCSLGIAGCAPSPSLGSQRRLALLAGLQAPPFNV